MTDCCTPKPTGHSHYDLAVVGAGSAGFSAAITAAEQGANVAKGSTFRIAPFAGIELPTGDDDDADSLGRLPATLQLGSGSWDPLFGVVATWQTLQYQIDAQASYKVNTEANGFEFGDELRLDARNCPQARHGGTPARPSPVRVARGGIAARLGARPEHLRLRGH